MCVNRASEVLQSIIGAERDARSGFAIALSEAIEAVLDAVDSQFQGTIEQFRLAADTAEVAEAADWAKLAAREARTLAPAQAGSGADGNERHEDAMTVLAAFLTPGALGRTKMADVRLLAHEGDRLRGRGGLTGLEH
jgi:hypothetical protein